jgi:hypothetical protein
MAQNPGFDPDEYARQQQAIQLGQALMQQGMQPNQGQMISGHYVAPSATQYLASLAQVLGGSKMASGGNAYLMKQNIGNMNSMLSRLPGYGGDGSIPMYGQQPMPQPTAQPTPGGASVPFSPGASSAPNSAGTPQGNPYSGQTSAPISYPAQANPFSQQNVIQSLILEGLSPEAAKAFWARTAPAPTQEMINWQAQGIDPRSIAPYTVEKAAKDGLIEKNGMYINPITMQPVGFVPEIPGGTMPTYNQGATAPSGLQTLEGQPITYPQALQRNAAGTAAGSGMVDMVQAYNPQAQQMELVPKTLAAQAAGGGVPGNNFGNIRPQGASSGFQSFATPQEGLAAIDNNLKAYGAKGINTLSGVINKWAPHIVNNHIENDTQAYIKDVSHRLGIDPNQPIDLNNPAIRQAVGTGIMLHEQGSRIFNNAQPKPMAAGPRLGDSAAATTQATNSQDAWAKLQEANRQAQTTTSYLQNINELAQKAIVGPASSKLAFANGLISLIPGATQAQDAQTANDLLKKYSSQIVTRLSSGGMGTDSARAILESAYPGAHMTADAIKEAVGNLVGANEMVKAKAALLAPYGNNRDAVGYQQKEMAFDQNADPRIWQYKALRESNPAAARTFLQGVLKQDPHFIDKADALSKLGAF